MKKWNTKNIVIAVLSVLLLGAIVLFLYGYKLAIFLDEWKSRHIHAENHGNDDAVTAQKDAAMYYNHRDAAALADAASSCEGHYFYGDTGYLLKGELLDPSVASAYNGMPDTITRIHYGMQLQHMNEGAGAFYNKKARFAPLADVDDNQALTSYLALAKQGKVSYLRLLPNSRNSLELENLCDFNNKYGDRFNPHIAWQRDLPLAMKEALNTFFTSEEGSHYTFVSDRRDTDQVVVSGTFTGPDPHFHKPKNELAIIVTNNDGNGLHRERILVLGFDHEKHAGYILYNEVFNHTKLLIKTYANADLLPEEAIAIGIQASASQQVIQLKTDGGARFYLYYEKEFDTMRRSKRFGVTEHDD